MPFCCIVLGGYLFLIIQQKSLNICFLLYYTVDSRETILRENFTEYFELALQALHTHKYNSAATLFFKAICAGVDLFIFTKEHVVPSSHTHRFRIVQEKYLELYDILDRDFPFYQDSYTKKMTKEAAEVLYEDAQRIAAMLDQRSN